MLGTATQIFGATVGPTTPSASLAVVVAPGRIYTQAPIEPSAWSSLPANATLTCKQGILLSAQTIACPVLGTTGQSVNYLIQGQFQENDSNFQTLSYYNASNPSQPFSGAGNNGIAQPTVRSGQFIVQAKAGTPATTGSQTTPAADSGWTALAVVTVAFGATTITSGNISVASTAPLNTGFFTVTYVGGTTAPTGLAAYSTNGPLVALTWPNITGVTSNSTGFSYSGIPGFLMPSAGSASITQSGMGSGFSGASLVSVAAQINGGAPNTLTFFNATAGTWTATGAKSANSGTIVYSRGF